MAKALSKLIFAAGLSIPQSCRQAAERSASARQVRSVKAGPNDRHD